MPSQYFTEEHEMFRKTVRDYVEKELQPNAEKWNEMESFPKEVFKRMGELGFLGIRYPQEYGGSGLDFFFTVVFIEELVKCAISGLPMSILVQTDMATPIISILGNEDQKKEFLIPAIKGEKIAALGITEPNAGSDVASIQTTARKDGDYYIINGTKMFITNGTRADFIMLAVKTDKEKGHQGISLFLLDTKTKGFSVGRKLRKMGQLCSDTGELVFEDCKIHKRYLLGNENEGFYGVMRNFQTERLVGAVSFVAGAQRVLDLSLKYAQERIQFGRPIGKFQVIRHKLVDMATEIEAAKQLVYHCAWLYNQGIDCVKEVSMAKLYTSEIANRIAYEGVQIHGGYGYMREYEVEAAYRDMRLGTIGGGTSEIMKEIISKMMGL